MPRDIYINGESLVLVKARPDSGIGSLTQLGLAEGPITITLDYRHMDINVNAWGEMPVDVQWMLGGANIQMTLVHFDPIVLGICSALAMGGGVGVAGIFNRAGQRLGNNQPRFGPGGAEGNQYIGLNITSTVAATPWRFFYAYLASPPITWPLGNERSLVQLNWRAIPYTQDPWGGSASQPGTIAGFGARGALLWDHSLDS